VNDILGCETLHFVQGDTGRDCLCDRSTSHSLDKSEGSPATLPDGVNATTIEISLAA
jgi:hypothetical protein